LNTIASPAARLPGPLVILVRSLTIAKVSVVHGHNPHSHAAERALDGNHAEHAA
jgi:hypothetical protein